MYLFNFCFSFSISETIPSEYCTFQGTLQEIKIYGVPKVAPSLCKKMKVNTVSKNARGTCTSILSTIYRRTGSSMWQRLQKTKIRSRYPYRRWRCKTLLSRSAVKYFLRPVSKLRKAQLCMVYSSLHKADGLQTYTYVHKYKYFAYNFAFEKENIVESMKLIAYTDFCSFNQFKTYWRSFTHNQWDTNTARLKNHIINSLIKNQDPCHLNRNEIHVRVLT